MITIYTLIQESVTGLNGEKVTCGHLSCNEKSTLRLNDVLRSSGDYTFQMKIKAKAASTVQLSIGTLTENFSVTTSFQQFNRVCKNINTATHKYIEITFPSGDYWFYNMQLEMGNLPTAWSLCLDDLNDAIGAQSTWIEQTTQKISLFAQKNDVNEAKAEMRVEADGMISEALKSYVTSDDFGDYKTETKTRFEQTDNQFGFYVQKDTYDGLNSTVNNLKSNQENYFQFDANGLRIGKKNNPYQVVIDNEKYQMLGNGQPLMYIQYGELNIPDVIITHQLRMLGYSFTLDSAGNMNCQFVGTGG